MEGQSSAASNLIPSEGSYSFSGLQEPMQVNQEQSPQPYQNFMALPHQVKDGSPLGPRKVPESDQYVSILNYKNKLERGKSSVSEDDASNVVEEGMGKEEVPWPRVKWSDKTVKLLITAVSYVAEEAYADSNVGGRRKSSILPKKGKWKFISKIMAERGYHISPQQCEDKFNDLNKRYKKLNDILGRGTSCKVVENPALLDLMDLSDKAKDDVKKILSSKQLFYEEMCSYHNGNRLYLPHDQSVHRSMQLALKSKDNFECQKPIELDEEDQDVSSDDQNVETDASHPVNRRIFTKKRKELKLAVFGIASNLLRPEPLPRTNFTSVNCCSTKGSGAGQFQNQRMISRLLQLEEKKLDIQVQSMELERQRLKWTIINQQEDRELAKMKQENENMKLENERLALHLKFGEFHARYN